MRMKNKMNIISAILLALAGALLYGMTAGLRGNIGVLFDPIIGRSGVAYGDVSFIVAVMQLVFGIAQPLFGILAMKKSNRFVLLLGVVMLTGGVLLLPFAVNYVILFIALAVGFGVGTGAISFGIVLSAVSRRVGSEQAMIVSGILNASSGMGAFVLTPVIQKLLDTGGLNSTAYCLSIPLVLLIPVIIAITSTRGIKKSEHENEQSKDKSKNVLEVFREAFKNRSYRLLICGFATCGFHMVIIEAHLYSQYLSYGMEAQTAAWVFSAYGIATIIGALLSGLLSMRLPKGKLLGFYYGFRAVWVALYMFLLPKTPTASLIFSIGLGLTGDATVSPTSGIVNREFHITRTATLIGFLFFCHQVGAFLSSWLGGVFVETTGGYVLIWNIDILLCVFASVMSIRIKDKKMKICNS